MSLFDRKPSGIRGVASDMAEKRPADPDPPRAAATFGRRALDLATAAGKSRQQLMDDADISSSTLKRLLRGDGSMLAARAVKDTLRAWGVDVSALPAIDADENGDAAGPMDPALRDGLALVRRLWQLASDEKFRVELERLRDLVRAHELVAEGTDRITRQR